MMDDFYDFQIVDLKRARSTAKEKIRYIRKFLRAVKKNPLKISREDVRSYLKGLSSVGAATYSNTLKSLKVFFRDFMQRPVVVATFKFPQEMFKPKVIPSKKDLQRFYKAVESAKEKALFLIYASSGLRRSEVLKLKRENVDFALRKIIPQNSENETKHTWVSFYNLEAEEVLKEYLSEKKASRSERIFPMARKDEKELWRSARERTSLQITPKVLREWFCDEMGRLGVADRYVDAFCGRTPRTILAKHYTDFSPGKLKVIYDKANLKVLS
ncbi:MAG: tyrosine-type recombinase/integrase [Candidatus Bathyarchaeota archaeon]|nr:MAG: tyrosine-type recombinase/integrase [Candidatus Bathyarchaeota archaeon]